MLKELNQLYLVNKPVDMRKSINSLSIMISEQYQQNPSNGQGFVFYNRVRDKIKILYFDNNGFVLYYKRFEVSTIKVETRSQSEDLIRIGYLELLGLLQGLDIKNLKIPDKLICQHFSRQ